MSGVWETLVDWRSARGGRPIVTWESTPLSVLWALSVEIDQRTVTISGSVCRACGGRGEVWQWGRHHEQSGDIDRTGDIKRPLVIEVLIIERVQMETFDDRRGLARWAWREECPCDGPSRPHTISLAHLVETLAELPSPRFEWPDQWLVELDAMAFEPDDWVSRWWLAFREWTLAGKLPDAEALAVDLRALLPKPRRFADPPPVDVHPDPFDATAILMPGLFDVAAGIVSRETARSVIDDALHESDVCMMNMPRRIIITPPERTVFEEAMARMPSGFSDSRLDPDARYLVYTQRDPYDVT